MSKELELIAECQPEHDLRGSQQMPGCACGWQGELLEHPPWHPIPGVADALHAAHVVSRLSERGYSIVGPAEGDPDTSALDEARSWARHGYEIGQRSGTWVDHGVAPKWLIAAAAAAAEEDTNG